MTRERLVERVAELEPVLTAALAPLRLGAARDRDPRRARPARRRGARCRRPAADPGLVDRVVHACRDHGVLTRGLAGRALQISPPYVITEAELERVAAGMAAALAAVAAASPAAAAV